MSDDKCAVPNCEGTPTHTVSEMRCQYHGGAMSDEVRIDIKYIGQSTPGHIRFEAGRFYDHPGQGVVVLVGAMPDGDLVVACAVKNVSSLHAGQVLGELGVRGGGRQDLAQGGIEKPDNVDDMLETWREKLSDMAREK